MKKIMFKFSIVCCFVIFTCLQPAVVRGGIKGYKYNLKDIEKQAIIGIKKADEGIEKKQKTLLKDGQDGLSSYDEMRITGGDFSSVEDSVSVEVNDQKIPLEKTLLVLEDKITLLEIKLKQKVLDLTKTEEDAGILKQKLFLSEEANKAMAQELQDTIQKLKKSNVLMVENVSQVRVDLDDELEQMRIENSFLQEKLDSITKEYEDLKESIPDKISQATAPLIEEVRSLENKHSLLKEENSRSQANWETFAYEKKVILKRLNLVEDELIVAKSLLPIKFNLQDITTENKIRILEERFGEIKQQLFYLKQ